MSMYQDSSNVAREHGEPGRVTDGHKSDGEGIVCHQGSGGGGEVRGWCVGMYLCVCACVQDYCMFVCTVHICMLDLCKHVTACMCGNVCVCFGGSV